MRVGMVLVVCVVACGGDPPKAIVAASTASTTASAAPSASCADVPSTPYEPQPAWSGRAANVPDPPTLPSTAQRVGDAYTVYGALRALHAIDAPTLLASPISIVGYIVDTNIAHPPRCAFHRTGMADPPGCVTPIPELTISDDKTPTASSSRVRVMGFASNFANVFDAAQKDRAHDTSPRYDELWGKAIPAPLPAVGVKVRVTGRYGVMFTRSGSGVESDPRTGILTFDHLDYLP